MLLIVFAAFALGLLIGWVLFSPSESGTKVMRELMEADLAAKYNEGLIEGKKFMANRYGRAIVEAKSAIIKDLSTIERDICDWR